MSEENKNSSIRGLFTLSDVLMVILIIVTAYIGFKSYQIQEEGVELQRSIYQPKFAPSDTQQPKIISEKTLTKVSIYNLGYTSGLYNIKITSNTFSFDSERYGAGRELNISYMLKHDDSDTHEFYILPPRTNKKPVFASYVYEFSGDGNFRTTRAFCYQLKNSIEYVEVGCQ
ncbi:hypothetical protein ACEUAN_17220 [Aeromonas veronii]